MSGWPESLRSEARQRWEALSEPSAREEAYRFTPVERWRLGGGGAAAGELRFDPAQARQLAGSGAWLSTVSGGLAADAQQSWLRGALGPLSAFPGDKLACEAEAGWTDGLLLRVPAGLRLPGFVFSSSGARGGRACLRNFIELGDGAEATLVQELGPEGSPERFLELSELRLGKGACLHWVQLQNFGTATMLAQRQLIELGAGARLRTTPLHCGAGWVQCRQSVRLTGEDSELETLGAAHGAGEQHFDFWLEAVHAGARSRVEMDYRFVMDGKARGVFNGLVDVAPGVPGCEAVQRCRSLLLGGATVHAMPKLLIRTDAVKASHGAAVSSIPPEQLYYLESRGIPAPEAERMIVRGFTEPALQRVPDELRARFSGYFDQKSGAVHD